MRDLAHSLGRRCGLAVAAFVASAMLAAPALADAGYWKLKGFETSPAQDTLDSGSGKETGQKVRGLFEPKFNGAGAASLEIYSRVRACKKRGSKQLDICVSELKFEVAAPVEIDILTPGRKLSFKTTLTMGENNNQKTARAYGLARLGVGDEMKDLPLTGAEVGKPGGEQGEIEIPGGAPDAELTMELFAFFSSPGDDFAAQLTARYAWTAGTPSPPPAPAPAASATSAPAALAKRSDVPRTMEEPALGFALRVPAGWDLERRETPGQTVWRIENPVRVGPDLLTVVVALVERTPGKDAVESLQELAREWATKLKDGKVTEFGPFRMGAMAGLSVRLSGVQEESDVAPVAVSAIGLQFEAGERRLMVVAIAPAASAALLDAIGQPGAILGPSETPRTDRPPPPADAAKQN